MQYYWNVQYSVPGRMHVFLIPCDNYQYKFAILGVLHIIPLSQNLMTPFFYLTDGRFLCYTRTFECWVTELFATFIDTNMIIPCFFFIFICAQCLLFVLNIICTWSLFIFTRARNHFVVAFQFHRLYCFFDVSNFFVYAWFNKVSPFLMCLSLLISLLICLIRNN